MDDNVSVSEMRHSERQSNPVPNLTFKYLNLIDPATYDPEKLRALWERLSAQDYAFDDFCRGDMAIFAQSLCDSGSFHFEFQDKGYLVVRNLAKSDNAYIHFSTWEHPNFRDVLAAGREVIDFLFKHCGIERITAPIPVYNKPAIKFATVLGFRFEGEMRNAILFFEKHYGVSIYGLLKSEWERARERWS